MEYTDSILYKVFQLFVCSTFYSVSICTIAIIANSADAP